MYSLFLTMIFLSIESTVNPIHLWDPSNVSSSSDFEIIKPFRKYPSAEEIIQQLRKTNLKLSLLNHTKRIPFSNENHQIWNYIFHRINQKLNTEPSFIKSCIDFMADENFPNRIILELDNEGKVLRCITDLVGFSSREIENKNVELLFTNFSMKQINDLIHRDAFCEADMVVGTKGKVEIFIHSTSSVPEYLLLLRY